MLWYGKRVVVFGDNFEWRQTYFTQRQRSSKPDYTATDGVHPYAYKRYK